MKKDEKTEDQTAELAALEVSARPLAGQTKKPIDEETASHQWQPGSAAADTNVLSEHINSGDSILEKIDTKENLKAREDAAKALSTYDENVDCSKLDVSDVNYCQPGSERHKDYVKKNK